MTIMSRSGRNAALMLATPLLGAVPLPAQAQSNEALQRQIDELKAQVQALTAALTAKQAASVAPAAASSPAPVAVASAPTPPAAAASAPAKPASQKQPLALRGYTQMRYSKIVAGDATAPAGQARLR
jgi:cell division septum initiation protein DivIVA